MFQFLLPYEDVNLFYKRPDGIDKLCYWIISTFSIKICQDIILTNTHLVPPTCDVSDIALTAVVLVHRVEQPCPQPSALERRKNQHLRDTRSRTVWVRVVLVDSAEASHSVTNGTTLALVPLVPGKTGHIQSFLEKQEFKKCNL